MDHTHVIGAITYHYDIQTNIEAKREQAISDLLKKEDLGLI
jgi:hypothetical protein